MKSSYPGSLLECKEKNVNMNLGNRSILSNYPAGAIVSSISSNNKIRYSKSAGSFAQLLEKKGKHAKLRLPSGKIYLLSLSSYATLGAVGNSIHKLTKIGKAGRNRLKGIRPAVRGIAMNPVDHPHGGRSNKGMPQLTPWGLPTKNYPTARKKI